MTVDDSAAGVRTTVAAGILGVCLASFILLLASRGDVDRMVRSDGLVYRYVASHLTDHPDEVIWGPAVIALAAALLTKENIAVVLVGVGIWLGAGPFAWHFTAEAARVFVILQLFAILALMALLARRMGPPRQEAATSEPPGRPAWSRG